MYVMTFEHKNIDDLKGKFEDGDRPIGEDFARLLDSCHNSKQDTDVGITKTLTVSGTATFKGPMETESSLSVDGWLGVTGSTTLHGTLGVSGVVSLNDNLSVAGGTVVSALTGTGDTVLTKTLSVAQGVVCLDTLGVTGPATLTSTLNVLSSTELQSTTIHGVLSSESNATFDQNVHIKGDLRVDGNAYLSAGAGGSINVGDSGDDNLIFNADIASNVNVDADVSYDLGSVGKRWSKIYVADIDVTGHVDGRDVSHDGFVLDNVHTAVNNSSADWNNVYTNVSSTSAARDSVYSNVNSNSANWESAHSSVLDTSANWDNTYTNVSNSSANWNNVYTNVYTTSAARDSVYSNVNTNSGDWSEVYATTQSNSSSWGIDANTDALEHLVDVDTAGVVNNSILKYDSNTGLWRPSVDVGSTGTPGTSSFVVLDDTPVTYGGSAGQFLKVNNSETGIEFITHPVDQWNSTYTNISTASGDWNTIQSTVESYSASWEESAEINLIGLDVTAMSNASADWNSTHASVLATSSDWDSTHASVLATSGDWNSVHASVLATSADWNSVHASVLATSADWNNVHASVLATSADWNSVHASVLSTSADWNSTHASVLATSADWNSVHASVLATSGDWNNVHASVLATSADWNSVHAVVLSNSGSWDSTYVSVLETSASWDSTHASVVATSADWNSTHASVLATSADWNNVHASVVATSADWDSTHASVLATSADWDSVYSYINSSSGLGLPTVDVNGKILTSYIPELSITRVHATTSPSEVASLNPANGIQTGDVVVVSSTHDNLIAVVDGPTGTYTSSTGDYVGYAKLALPDGLVQTVNGKPGPSVVLNPDDLDDSSTAHKFVNASDIQSWNSVHTSVGTNSAGWEGGNDAFVNVSTNSGNWNSVHTSVGTNSAGWEGGNDAFVNVTSNSSNWNSVYTSVGTNSAGWDHTTVRDASANWDAVYSYVNGDSATNNTSYNQSQYVNSSGDTITGKIEIVGSELEVGGNITLAGDLIHQDDTGTKISFNTDTITLEANGQEFITIDGTLPTPDTVIINEAASTEVHFIVKTPTDQSALYFSGTTGSMGLGTSSPNAKLSVVGSISASENLDILGTATATNVDVTGQFLSAGVPLEDIFSTDVEIHNDLTVHGNTYTEDISANNVTALSGYHTITGGLVKTGITQNVNIGGRILEIVNGLIVGVSDE